MEFFLQAQPVWLAALRQEMNVHLLFRTPLEGSGMMLHIAAADVYRVWVDNTLIGYGPARAAHGCTRVDHWEIPEGGELKIEVACYRVNNFCYPLQNGFLQAEVRREKEVLAATGRAQDFLVAWDKRWRQRIQRYSYQRTFAESVLPQWKPNSEQWQIPQPAEQNRLLERRLAYPHFSTYAPCKILRTDRLTDTQATAPTFRHIVQIDDTFLGYPPDQLDHRPDVELLSLHPAEVVSGNRPFALPLLMREHQSMLLWLGAEKSGFFHISGHCNTAATLYLSFDEILSEGDVNFQRMECTNVITLTLAPGAFSFESMEPYSAQYLRLAAVGGEVSVDDLFLREYASPAADTIQFRCEDTRIQAIFEAARETYRQNAVDLFTDCPSRERAGWLCDSFFLGRSEQLLTADNAVEQNFLENYAMGDFSFLPPGMLAMCYPANHNSGQFIPNWAMWFILELEEAVTQRGMKSLKASCRPLVENLFRYLQPFEWKNELLAHLESWVFVEWSRTADFVQDINFPTNMLYAAALQAAGRLYQEKKWIDKGSRIKKCIYELSFNGNFFVDNALLSGNKLTVTENTTECCQYYALYFGILTKEQNPAYFEKMRTKFGPYREDAEVYPGVYRANAFIGNYLRLEILRREGYYQDVIEQCIGYFAKMANQTGTLWENDTPVASCNHGFASYTANLILSVAGVEKVDSEKKHLCLRPHTNLPPFACTLPLTTHDIAQIQSQNGNLETNVPAGWKIVWSEEAPSMDT